MPGLRLWGPITADTDKRTPTFCMRADSFKTANSFGAALLKERLAAGAYNFFAIYFSEDLGLESTGGYVRVAFVHYNTVEEVERAAGIVARVAKRGEE